MYKISQNKYNKYFPLVIIGVMFLFGLLFVKDVFNNDDFFPKIFVFF